MSEFGIVAPIRRNGLQTLRDDIETGDTRVPEEARACLQMLFVQLELITVRFSSRTDA